MASTFNFNAVFKQDTTLENAWSIFDENHGSHTFLAGEKAKCMIGNDGIRFCKKDKNGVEVYSHPFDVSSIADSIILKDFLQGNIEREIIKPTNGYNSNVPYERYTCSYCSYRIRFNAMIESMNYCPKCGAMIKGIIDKKI